MAELKFRIQADYEKVQRLREEIAKLKQEIGRTDAVQNPNAFNALNSKLVQTSQELGNVEAKVIHAGVAMETDFRQKIFAASQGVNDFTEKIIAQKAVVKDVASDVKQLGDAYREAKKYTPMSADGKLAEWKAAKRALEEEKAALFNLTQEQATARLSVKKLRDEYALFRKEGGGAAQTMELLTSKMKGIGAAIFGGMGLKELAGHIISVRAEFESMETSLKVLLGGDEARLNSIMSQIKEYALASPLNTKDMVGAVQMMTSFGIEAEKSIGYLKAIGDISMGDTAKFNGLALVFSQISSAGKLMGQDLMQCVNHGFNPLEEISRKTGKSIGQLKEEMSKGAISAQMVQDAFISATSAGGKFYGMSSEGAKTLNGQISMLQESFDNMFNEIGSKGEGVIMSAVKAGTYLVENYETIGKIIEEVIIVYGSYRAALVLNIAIEKAQAISRLAAIKGTTTLGLVTDVLKAKTAALNATLLANPYVAVSAAVLALIGTIYTFVDTTDAASEAQKRLNAANAEVEKSASAEISKLDTLREKLESTKKGSDEWKSAKDAIIEQYGQYDSKLAAEIERTGTLTTSYENLTIAIRKSIAARQLKQFYDSNMQATQDDIQKSKKDTYDKLVSAYGKEDAAKIMPLVNEYITTGKGLDKKLTYTKKGLLKDAKFAGTVRDALIGTKGIFSFAALRDVELAREAYIAGNKSLDDYIVMNNISEKEKNEILYGVKPTDKTTGKTETAKRDLEEKRKNLQAKLDGLSEAKAKGKEGARIKKEIAEISQRIDAAYSTSDKGGKTAASGTERRRKQEIKDAQAQQKAENDLNSKKIQKSQLDIEIENQLEQSRIDAMKDGAEKTFATMKLAHKKELEQLEFQKEERLKKKREIAEAEFKADPKNKNKAFNAQAIVLSEKEIEDFDKINKNILEKQKNEIELFHKKQEQIHTTYLKEYGSMQERRAALAKEYDEKISNESNEWARKTLEKQKEQALQSFDFSEFQNAINWDVVFGDLTKVSEKALATLEKQLNAVRSKISSKGVLSSDDTHQLKIITEALQKIMERNASISPFKIAKNGIKEYQIELERLQRAQENMNVVNATSYDGVVSLGEAYEDALAKQDMVTIAKIQDTYVTTKVTDANGKTKIAVVKYIDALKALQQQQVKTSESAKKLEDAIRGVGNTLSEMSQIGDKALKLAENIGIKMPESIGKMIDGLGEMGNAMEAFDISKPGSFLNIKNYVSFANGVVNVFKGVGKTIGGIFGFGGSGAKRMREFQSAVAKYSSLRDIWGDLIDRKKEYLGMSWGSDAYKTQKEIEALQQAELKSIIAEAYSYFNTKDKHHGKSHTNWTWQSDAFSNGKYSKGHDHNNEAFWEDLVKKLKENGFTKDRNNNDLDIKGVGDLFNLTYEELLLIKQLYPERWAALSKETKEYLNQYMESLKRADDATKEYMDSIIGSISQISDALQNFADNSETSIEDVTNAFNKMINNSIWQELTKKGGEYYKRLEEYRKHYEEAVSDGHLSEEEKKALEEEYTNIYKDLNRDYDKRVSEMGTGKVSPSQNATANNIAEISYDQANNLTGIATSIQIAGETRNVKLDAIGGHLSLMNVTISDIRNYLKNADNKNIADETRTILANSYIELQGIHDDTSAMSKTLKTMGSDVSDIKHKLKNM